MSRSNSTYFMIGLILLLAFDVCLAQATSTPIGPQYITSHIVWGLLVGLLLLFVLYIGLGCIMDVQRPVRMTAVPLQLSKEY